MSNVSTKFITLRFLGEIYLSLLSMNFVPNETCMWYIYTLFSYIGVQVVPFLCVCRDEEEKGRLCPRNKDIVWWKCGTPTNAVRKLVFFVCFLFVCLFVCFFFFFFWGGGGFGGSRRIWVWNGGHVCLPRASIQTTQTYHKMCILFTGYNLRTLRFKSS